MQQQIKRRIAKEVILFFASVFIVFLIWLGFWINNKYFINQFENLQNQIPSLQNFIDSTNATFPKAKTFDQMLGEGVPSQYFIDRKPNPFDDTAENKSPKIIDPKDESSIAKAIYYESFDKYLTVNLIKLYRLLNILNYPFNSSLFKKDELVSFKNFKEKISDDIDDYYNRKELKKIYEFLKIRKCVNVTFNHFAYNIKDFRTPNHEPITALEDSTLKLEQIKKEIIGPSYRIRSDKELKKIGIQIGLIVMSIVYPFRFLVLLLVWAIKTLKQK